MKVANFLRPGPEKWYSIIKLQNPVSQGEVILTGNTPKNLVTMFLELLQVPLAWFPRTGFLSLLALHNACSALYSSPVFTELGLLGLCYQAPVASEEASTL